MLRPLRFIRRFIGLIVLVVVLAIVGIIAAFVHIDNVGKYLVESGTTAAVGLESRTEQVNVSLVRRNVGVDALTVVNPEDYEGPLLMEARRIDGRVRAGTLLTDVVEVPLLELDGVTLHIEQRGRTNNFTAVLDHMQQPREAEPRWRFHVDRVVIRNIDANVRVLEQLGDRGVMRVHVPEIVLDDIGTDPERGAGVAEIVARVVPVILAAVLEQGRDLPGQLRAALTEDLGELAAEAGGEVTRLLTEELERRLDLEQVPTELLDRFLNRRRDED